MPWHVFEDSTNGAIYVFCVVTAPVCAIATALRFLASHRSGRGIGIEDYLAFGALATHIASIVLELLALKAVDGRPLMKIPPKDLLEMGKLVYAFTPMFPVNQFFAKFSLLFLYYRIFSIDKFFVRSIYVLGAIQICYSVVTFFLSIFSCHPVSLGWTLIGPGSCIDHSKFLAGSETVNSSVDFAMVALACFMIQKLRMKMATKLKLVVLFVLGGLSGVVGFVKVGEAYAAGGQVNITSALWTTIQQACSCICCCAPVYASLVPKHGRWARILGSGSASRSSHDGSIQARKLEMMNSSSSSSNARTTTESTRLPQRPGPVAGGVRTGGGLTGDDWLFSDVEERGEAGAGPGVQRTSPEWPRNSLRV